ncbi:MAG: hypothetical protein GX594_17360 [Pirellulaceae bacterium]|nr:hypothetical protein [Pirellulaceae bacterium]
MNEFVDKGLSSIAAYAPPDNRFYEFNVTATGEWLWNSKGRDAREFAAAWATRRGIDDPEKAADWAVTLGPVGWDVYGSLVLTRQRRDSDARWIKNRRAPGKRGMFSYLPNIEHIDSRLEDCRRAMRLAREMNELDLIAETKIIHGYVRMVKALHLIAQTVGENTQLSADNVKNIRKHYADLADAGEQVAVNLQLWRDQVAPGFHDIYFQFSVDTARRTVKTVGEALESVGVDLNMANTEGTSKKGG